MIIECEECDMEGADAYTRSTRHFILEDEVFKLKLLIEGIINIKGANERIIYYIEEKVSKLVNGYPISLDGSKHGLFNDWKRIREAKQYNNKV